jgi:hypothetical protein
MSRGTFATAAVLAAAVALPAGTALAATTPGTTGSSVTATGLATVKVKPANRHDNASIVAAVEKAEKAGIKPAIADAKQYAEIEATAAGLTLGSIIAVSDNVQTGLYPVGVQSGPFGLNKYCGFVRQIHIKIIKRSGHKFPKVIRGKRVFRCFVPPSETTTLAVTWSAT